MRGNSEHFLLVSVFWTHLPSGRFQALQGLGLHRICGATGPRGEALGKHVSEK